MTPRAGDTPPRLRRPGWAGPAAAGAALLAQFALHTAAPRVPFAPFSAGEWIVRRAPGGLATAAIDSLGHQALHVLAALTVAGALAVGLALGRAPAGALGLVALAATLAATLLDPRSPDLTRALAGGVVAAVAAIGTVAAIAPRPVADAGSTNAGRRRLLLGGLGGLGALALGGAALARSLRHPAPGVVRADRILRPRPDPALAALPGLSPAVTSRRRHYVVDINLDDPAVDAGAWRLRIGGAVERPVALALDDLRAMPTIERLVALSCISNPVGGELVGNSRWTGVPVADLLRAARPRHGAAWMAARAIDGYAETIPLELARRDDVLVAFGMNGALLPRAHGFPARLLVPGRYGVKNVKWLGELVVSEEQPTGYWAQRGWDRVAAVRTQSRFDLPAHGDEVPGRFRAAGIAWAGDRRIAGVEVSADDGRTWRPAALEGELDPLSWRRWWIDLELPSGPQPLTVRAVDGAGQVQDATRRPRHPSGASGHHRIVVTVRS